MKDIAVIGAGIIGICTAYHLQKSGYKVTIFDHKDPGSMASYGHACTFADYACTPVNSPSIIKNFPSLVLKRNSPLTINFSYLLKNMPWAYEFLKNCRKDKVEYITSSLANFLSHSRLAYDNIFNEVNVSQYINHNEALYLFSSEKEYESAKYNIDLRKKNGINIKELNINEINEIEPHIAPVYYCGLMFKGSRYTTNPMKISRKIFESFINLGGNFSNKKITSIDDKSNDVKIWSDNVNYNFKKIVICAGIWSKELAMMVGDNFPLDTERGYHVLFNNKENLINRPIGWSKSGFYLTQIEEGIRAAGTVEIAGIFKKPNKKIIKMIENEARKIIPKLKDVKSTWLGFRPTLPDSMPVIGSSLKNKNILYAFGHQHLGWTLGAITGEIINALVNNKKPNIDIKAFKPERFNL